MNDSPLPQITIEEEDFLDLSIRESEWLNTIQTNKISADDFYRSHRNAAYGEISYRQYILEKLQHIMKYTDEENYCNAAQAIVLGRKIDYEVPIEFTRFLMKSIQERAERALEIIKKLRTIPTY